MYHSLERTVIPKLKWMKAQTGFIPEGALVAGKEADGKPLYLARAYYNPHKSDVDMMKDTNETAGWHPGKVAPHLGGAHIGFGDQAVVCRDYEVLIAKNPEWVKYQKPDHHRRFPFMQHRGADEQENIDFFKRGLMVGRDINGHPLYCCKIHFKGSEQIGKAGPHIKDKNGEIAATFAYGNEEFYSTEFEMLHKVEESGVTTRWLYVADARSKESLTSRDWALGFVGGWEADGRPLYICRAALHNGEPAVMPRVVAEHLHRDVDNTHPGKCAPHLQGAHVAWGEKEIVVTSGYEILLKNEDPYDTSSHASTGASETSRHIVNPRILTHHEQPPRPRHIEVVNPIVGYKNEVQGRYRWVRSSNGDVPESALQISRDEGGLKLYSARFEVDGKTMQLGKVGKHLGFAHVPFGGKTIISKEYEVLCKNE